MKSFSQINHVKKYHDDSYYHSQGLSTPRELYLRRRAARSNASYRSMDANWIGFDYKDHYADDDYGGDQYY